MVASSIAPVLTPAAAAVSSSSTSAFGRYERARVAPTCSCSFSRTSISGTPLHQGYEECATGPLFPLVPRRFGKNGKKMTASCRAGVGVCGLESCGLGTSYGSKRRGDVIASVSTADASQVVDGDTKVEPSTIVDVELGDRSYPIYIGAGLLERGDLLRKHVTGKQVLIVTNETVAPLYLDRVTRSLINGGEEPIVIESVVLPDGEEFKSLEVLMSVFDKAIEARLDRRCTFVALGGGVIGDMCGFAASVYVRGVNFIQIPTTLMAQVDSSVGGKTGVNHPRAKNMLGAFYQPQCVLIDTQTLNTLPDRELASGISEVVKYGLIRDGPFFEWQEANMDALLARDPGALAYAIKRSCENKAAVVQADERESGVRATLNLGHTFGHAIEAGIGYGGWLHGEAVAAGTIMAVDMSHRLGWIEKDLVDRVTVLLERARLPIKPPEIMTVEKFKSIMAVDKKVADGHLRLILLKGALGGCVFTGDFDGSKLDETLESFCSM